MNRFRLAAIFACVVLFASCGTKNVSEPEVVDDGSDSLAAQARFDSLVTEAISGIWSYETIQQIGGAKTTITANATVLPSGVSSDTITTLNTSGGSVDNPSYATQRTWNISGKNLVFVKTSCSKQGNDGIWAAQTCAEPLNDTLDADSLLDGSLLALRSHLGPLPYQRR